MPDINNIRQEIVDAFEASNYNITTLARISGWERPHLSNFLAGKHDCTTTKASRLMDALGLRIQKPRSKNMTST